MKSIYYFFFFLVAMSSHAQLRTGLLVGGGLGFDRNVAPNMKNPDIIEKVAKGQNSLKITSLIYSWAIVSVLKTRNIPGGSMILIRWLMPKCLNRKMSGLMQVVLRANDANLSLALSSSVNYKIVKGLYAGLGLEPTWYVASDGKKFDIPLFMESRL